MDRRQQIEDLCRSARELAPDRRSTFLSRVCGGDSELLHEVESRLSRDARDWPADAASTIAPAQKSPWTTNTPPPSVSTEAGPNVVAERSLPASIGHYRIVRLLGEGGMGAVYEAEQEHPRRIVALKVIKPGPGGAELLWRFDQESRVLGRL